MPVFFFCWENIGNRALYRRVLKENVLFFPWKNLVMAPCCFGRLNIYLVLICIEPLNTDGLLLYILSPCWLKSCKSSVSPPPLHPQEDDLSHRGRLYGSHIPAVKWSRQSRPPRCWRGGSAACAHTQKREAVSSDVDSGIYVMLNIFGQNTFRVGPPVRQMSGYCSYHMYLFCEPKLF